MQPFLLAVVLVYIEAIYNALACARPLITASIVSLEGSTMPLGALGP